ncbi:hypothetical protein PV10_01392 [Exophiala mesophila]|uniref:Uncharacterized protein n=1 Tax=Exophiala mesophila TaxID=212818 RepID=A0A0D1YAL1_EXOME|nr:uncharacterized protein PV10_01392 [Exophiala mesophila]KIV97676.1 hypothetical protein PV10_01392 [Exophiala mesophila]
MFYRCIPRGQLISGGGRRPAIRHGIEALAKSASNHVPYADTSNSDLTTPEVSPQYQNPWNERREMPFFNRKLMRLRYKFSGQARLGFTWIANGKNRVSKQTILENLPPSQRFVIRSLVFLATPSQVHLLDQRRFLKDVLKRVFSSNQHTDRGPNEIKTIAAVVDALPDFSLYPQSLSPAEGISILISGESIEDMSTPSKEHDDNEDHYTLQFITRVFRDPIRESHMLASHVQLPVANTVFVNGTRATLFEDTWDVKLKESPQKATRVFDPKPVVVVHQKRIPLQSSVIPLTHPRSPRTFISVPCEALTPPRKILNVMGNVVAAIEVDGVAVPASTELEKAVSKYLTDHPKAADNSPLGIYAYVWPESAASYEDSPYDLHGGLRSFPGKARLFKVTGGGGGWGKKKGLLSLDPAIDYGKTPEVSSFPDMDMLDNEEMEGEVKLKGMLPAESTIQFLVSNPKLSPFSPYHRSAIVSKNHHPDRSVCIFGTCLNPEGGDKVEVEVKKKKASPKMAPTCFNATFGMLSFEGSAVGLERSIDGKPFNTDARSRLDVPGAFTEFELPVVTPFNSQVKDVWFRHINLREIDGSADKMRIKSRSVRKVQIKSESVKIALVKSRSARKKSKR